MKKLLINLINFYQVYLSFDRGLLQPLAPGGACKYDTTCSQFTKEAIEKYGVYQGLVLGFKRIISCR